MVMPLGFIDLDDNDAVQKGGWLAMMTIVFVWCGISVTQPDGLVHVTHFGGKYDQLMGTILFNFAIVYTIPSWVNEKRPSVPIIKALGWSMAGATALFVLLGYCGGAGFPKPQNNQTLMNQVYNLGTKISQITFYLFPACVNLTTIPVNSIMQRYNLKEAGVCGAKQAAFWGVVSPWLIAIPLYTGSGYQTLVTWSGLVLISTVNFIFPPIMYILAIRKYGTGPDAIRTLHEEAQLTGNSLKRDGPNSRTMRSLHSLGHHENSAVRKQDTITAANGLSETNVRTTTNTPAVQMITPGTGVGIATDSNRRSRHDSHGDDDPLNDPNGVASDGVASMNGGRRPSTTSPNDGTGSMIVAHARHESRASRIFKIKVQSDHARQPTFTAITSPASPSNTNNTSTTVTTTNLLAANTTDDIQPFEPIRETPTGSPSLPSRQSRSRCQALPPLSGDHPAPTKTGVAEPPHGHGPSGNGTIVAPLDATATGVLSTLQPGTSSSDSNPPASPSATSFDPTATGELNDKMNTTDQFVTHDERVGEEGEGEGEMNDEETEEELAYRQRTLEKEAARRQRTLKKLRRKRDKAAALLANPTEVANAHEEIKPLDLTPPHPRKEPFSFFMWLIALPWQMAFFLTVPHSATTARFNRFWYVTLFMVTGWCVFLSFFIVWSSTVFTNVTSFHAFPFGIFVVGCALRIPNLLTEYRSFQNHSGDLNRIFSNSVWQILICLPIPWMIWTLANGTDPVLVYSPSQSIISLTMFLLAALVLIMFKTYDWYMLRPIALACTVIMTLLILMTFLLDYSVVMDLAPAASCSQASA